MPLNALGFVYREARDAWVNTERLFEPLRERPEVIDPPQAPPLRAGPGDVVFEHVGFHYEPARPVLVDVSLRHAIGVVPQDTALFNDTVGNNIAYGRIGSTQAEVEAACRAAQVHDLIASLPQACDTPVGERGVNISGGEKQRIAIARAILKDPPILIFDEATSALDSDSEHAITQELDRLSRNRTTLIIAHRLSTIVNADLIVVMDRGHIVEQGTHAELLRRKGMYARLWLLQQRMDKDMAR